LSRPSRPRARGTAGPGRWPHGRRSGSRPHYVCRAWQASASGCGGSGVSVERGWWPGPGTPSTPSQNRPCQGTVVRGGPADEPVVDPGVRARRRPARRKSADRPGGHWVSPPGLVILAATGRPASLLTRFGDLSGWHRPGGGGPGRRSGSGRAGAHSPWPPRPSSWWPAVQGRELPPARLRCPPAPGEPGEGQVYARRHEPRPVYGRGPGAEHPDGGG
jgi:hypothetical protein